MKKKLILTLLIFLYCTSIFANQRVNVGWFLSPGIHDGTSEDSVSGYDYEYLQKIQSYTNWDLHYIFGSFPECEQMLLDGEVDIIGYIGKTDERLKNFNFADLPSGTVNMYLICDKDNERLSFVDFDTFDGIKIANISSSYREQLLEDLSNDYGFNYTIENYDTIEELFEAVADGECDAALVSDISESLGDNFKIIYKSKTDNFYFVLNKNETALLNELNNALQQISINNIDYNEELADKYFVKLNDILNVSYSEKDMDYLKTNPKIKVIVSENFSPYSYIDSDTDEFTGIIIDYFNLIGSKTGISFEYVTSSKYRSQEDALAQGAGDIIAMESDDFDRAEDNNYKLTHSYISDPIGFIMKFNNQNPVKTIATIRGTYLPDNFYKEYEIEYFDTLEEVLKQVVNDEVDAGYIYELAFEMVDQLPVYKNLRMTVTESFDMNMAVGGNVDVALYSILEKSIVNISDSELSDIVYDNLAKRKYPSSLDSLKDNWAIMVLFVFLIFTLSVAIVILTKNNRLKVKNNEELQKALEKAKESDESKSLFLLSMSHDLRTPMNSIVGNSDLALRDLDDKNNVKSSLLDIKASSGLLSNIIDELLDLSSLEQYEIALKNEAFDISKLVEDLMERTKLVAKQKGLTSSYDIKTDHDIVIGDSKRLLRVFENIVNNSVIYSEKGNINLSMVENNIDEFNSEYKVVISDTGIGMSKEQLDRIFEKFYTAKSTKTYKTGGLGIGLNIAKGILDKMNASVEIESELGSGTVFTCKIPLKIVNSEGKKEKKEEIILDLSDKKLLLVEDIEINVKIMTKMLSKTSINVVVAHNGKEALDMFKADDSFDIIFMDLQMPVMDGYEATRQIRAIDSDKAKSIPIIAVSANAFDKDIIRALNAGVNEHFAKPIGLDRMLELLKRYF